MLLIYRIGSESYLFYLLCIGRHKERDKWGELSELLDIHGAILLRGYEVDNGEDLHQVVTPLDGNWRTLQQEIAKQKKLCNVSNPIRLQKE